MNITLTEVPTFTASVGDTKIEGLRVISEWNGMKELQNEKGEKLIVGSKADYPADSFGAIFGDIFGGDKAKSINGTVIAGSPDLIATLRAAQPATEAV